MGVEIILDQNDDLGIGEVNNARTVEQRGLSQIVTPTNYGRASMVRRRPSGVSGLETPKAQLFGSVLCFLWVLR